MRILLVGGSGDVVFPTSELQCSLHLAALEWVNTPALGGLELRVLKGFPNSCPASQPASQAASQPASSPASQPGSQRAASTMHNATFLKSSRDRIPGNLARVVNSMQ
jgi:hypothetical protein